MATQTLNKQALSDIASLQSYAPRQAALDLLAQGCMEEFLDWELGEGYVAANGEPKQVEERFAVATRRQALLNELALDGALYGRISDVAQGKEEDALLRLALERIPYLFASPLEIALRTAPIEAFEKTLLSWSSPERRFFGIDGSSKDGHGWQSFSIRSSILDKKQSSRALFDIGQRLKRHSLLTLALLLGKTEHAVALCRHGLRPDSQNEWDDVFSALQSFKGLTPDQQTWLTGCVEPKTIQAIEWLIEQDNLFNAMEEAAEELEAPQGIPKLGELLDQGASFSYYPMIKAMEWGQLDLLERMFKSGGNPNVTYKSGAPLMARIAGDEYFTLEALDLFLKYGTNPTMGEGAESYFGDGWNLSALASFVWSGRFEHLKKACDGPVAPIALRRDKAGYEPSFGDTKKKSKKPKVYYSQMLALALQKDHGAMAAWMIQKHGCRLDDLEPENGEPCSAFGQGDTIEEAKAAQLQAEMKASLPKPELRTTSSLANTP
ncbi:hypothetical protein [Rhodoferax aquaticus]|uniref:Ankyrin repeat domain-containing protein n=1 Tax=Rhodoferax aquaticus TaxID=2527691 RepID=A0A515EQR2_9BURK|nr:hypothetical protein [Rhodoferax aquaticus]QDL55001.1 hypothetical protein EXZ61_12965 [Rhodoferax aquaticus]